MLVQQTVIAAKDKDQFVMDKHAVAASTHWHLASGEGAMPHLRLHVQIDNFVAIGLLLAMVRTMLVAAPAKDIHALLLVCNGCMKISIRRRHTERLHITPFHRLQIERMHIAAELVYLVHKSAKDIHAIADDTRRMAIARARQAATDRWTCPARRLRIEAVEYIAQMLVVAAAPNVDALLVGDHSVAITLERHQRILQRIAIVVALLRHQSPAHRVHVQHMHIDGLIESVIVACAIAAKAIDELANANGCMIDPLWSTIQMHRPQHASSLLLKRSDINDEIESLYKAIEWLENAFMAWKMCIYIYIYTLDYIATI